MCVPRAQFINRKYGNKNLENDALNTLFSSLNPVDVIQINTLELVIIVGAQNLTEFIWPENDTLTIISHCLFNLHFETF